MKYSIGIDLGGTEIKIGIVDSTGHIHAKDTFKTAGGAGKMGLAGHMAACVNSLVQSAQMPLSTATGAGIGIPGLIDPEAGLVETSPNIPQISGVYLGPEMSRLLGIPVIIDNDVNAMTLGEMYYGAAKEYSDVVCLTLGTGVGGGLIFNKQVYRGITHSAGEIGHFTIEAEGIPCPCGNRGCLERYVARDGIISRFQSEWKKGKQSNIQSYLDEGKITPKAICRAAKSGDRLSIEVLAETGRLLGIGLASITNILNPEIFVVGGGIASAGDLILESTRKEIKSRAYKIPAERVKIVQAALGNDAGIVGAASLVMKN